MRKMQFKKGKIEKKYLVVLAAFVAAAVLLGTAAGILVGRGGGNLPAWLTVIVIILLVALPLLVLALLFAVAGEKRAEPSAAPRGSAAENGGTASEGGGAASEGETAEPVPAKGQKTRFDGLTRIDGRREAFGREQFDDDVTLPALCREFRNFAAGCLGLYYEESDIRRFVAGLAVSHIMILQGMSGTGKTSLLRHAGKGETHAVTVRRSGEQLQIRHHERRVGERLDKDAAGILLELCVELLRCDSRIHKGEFDAKLLKRLVEQIERAAVHSCGTDDVLSCMADIQHRHHGGGLSGGSQHRADAALQRRDLLLHRVKRRIGKTGIEKAVGLQVEQVAHLLGAFIGVRRALHDRHNARLAVARLVAGVNAGCVDMIHNPRSFSYRVTDFSAFYV